MVRTVRNLAGLLIILTLVALVLVAAGCRGISSQYLLTCEYLNPNTNGLEFIDVPVSQYEYEKVEVGDNYAVTIRTATLGIRIPVTRQTAQSSLALLDTFPVVFPIVFLIIPLVCLYRGVKGRRKEFLLPGIFMLLGVIGVSYLLISTTSPEFTASSIVIDKTFRIVGGGM